MIPAKDGLGTAPITKDEVKTFGADRPAEYRDSAALKLVVQDAARSEMWLQNAQWPLQWREIDILYQSPRTSQAWENGVTQRANVPRFTVAKHINSLVPNIMSGIFYDSPPFVIRPRPGTTQDTARAKSALFAALLDEIGFREECELALECMATNGTTICKAGWVTTRESKKKFVRKAQPAEVQMPFTGPEKVHTAESDEFEVQEVEVVTNRPFFEMCPLGEVLVDPGWRNPNQLGKAKFVIHRTFPTFRDLEKLRQRKGYNIPPEDELKNFFFPPTEIPLTDTSLARAQSADSSIHHAEGRDQRTTIDPLDQPLKMDERTDGEKTITVLQDKLIIRNEAHGMSRINFFSGNWWNIQNSGYGMGVGRLIGSDQRVEQGALGAALDILAMDVNPSYARSVAANISTQQIRSRLGSIVDVQGDVDKAFKLIETPKVPPEIWTVIAAAKAYSESTSGADEAMVQGSIPGKGSSIVRSGTGAGAVAAASAGRLQGPLGHFVHGVMLPFLAFMDEMVNEHMPMSEIRQIIGDELGKAFELDEENFLNARLKYEVLAGAHLAAKKAMAQSLPFLIQIFENPHLLESLNSMGWTVDVKELFDMLMEMSEWKNTRQVVRPMSKQESQSYQQSKMAAGQQKQAADTAKIAAKHAATAAEIDQTAEAKLASKLTETALERASGHEDRMVIEHALQPANQGTAQEFTAQ